MRGQTGCDKTPEYPLVLRPFFEQFMDVPILSKLFEKNIGLKRLKLRAP
jgi:hypothetical protein